MESLLDPTRLSNQPARGHRLGNAFQQILGEPRMGKSRADRAVSVLRHQYFAGSSLRLQTRRDVDAIADHGVIVAMGRSHIRCERCSGRNPDAHSQGETVIQPCVDVCDRFLDSKCRIHGAQHVIVVLDGNVKKRHQCIAEQTVDDSMVLLDDFSARFEKLLRNRRQFFDPELLRQPSVFPTVGEEYGDFRETARLPV